MKKSFISLLLSAVVVGAGLNVSYAQGQAANAGLTPENPFYFLDKLGETLQEFFTFNPEGKARLQITFVAERVAEIKVILETKGVKAKGWEVAQSGLLANIAKAATIVEQEKTKGKDVSQLARDINDEFNSQKEDLKEAFREQKRALKIQEEELKEKIREARLAGDTAQIEVLLKQLTEVKAQKDLLKLKDDEREEALEKEEEKLEQAMEAKEDAEEAIQEAEEEKEEMLDEASEEDVTLPADAFTKFDRLLSQAKELFEKGNYQGAKQLAKQAEKSLEKVADAAEELYKANENEQEMKDEKEFEGNDGAIEKSTRNSDLERAKEETNKAEEKLRGVGESEE